MTRVELGDDVVIFPGAKILGGHGIMRVGQGTVIAANAVLTRSTGDWEVWGGIPTRKIAVRPRSPQVTSEVSFSNASAGDVT